MAGAGLVRPRRWWGWVAWPAVAHLLSTAAPASDVRTVWPNMRGEIYSRSRAGYLSDRLAPGTPVAGWFVTDCGGIGPCGGFLVLGDDAVLLHDDADPDDVGPLRTDPRPLRWTDLPLETLRQADPRRALANARALGLITFSLAAGLPDSTLLLRCEAPRRVLAGDVPLPRFVRLSFDRSQGWRGAPAEYVLPVPGGFRGDTLHLACHPGVLRVEDGVAAALGMRVDSLARWIATDPEAHFRPHGAR